MSTTSPVLRVQDSLRNPGCRRGAHLFRCEDAFRTSGEMDSLTARVESSLDLSPADPAAMLAGEPFDGGESCGSDVLIRIARGDALCQVHARLSGPNARRWPVLTMNGKTPLPVIQEQPSQRLRVDRRPRAGIP